MPLVGLVSPLDRPEAIWRWSFDHARDHDAIDTALAGLGTLSPAVPLDPMPPFDDIGGLAAWLLRHQLKHSQMNTALKLQGSDLTKFDLSNAESLQGFAGTNYEEHVAVREAIATRGGHLTG